MIGDPFTMVVAIIAIITIGSIIKTKYQAKHGILEDEDMMGNKKQRLAHDGEKAQMASEITELKERIHVLERIATDNHGADDLERQIEELRNK